MAATVRRRDFAAYFSLVLQRLAPTHVLIANSERGYDALAEVQSERSGIVWVDLLHGQGGTIDNGGSPRYSAPVAHLLCHRITVTHYLRDLLIDRGESPERISTIHNSVRGSWSDKGQPASPRPQTIGFLGRLSPEKRPSVMFDIAKLLPDVHVVVAGDGPLRRALAGRRPANLEMVRYLDDPYDLFRRIDVLVVPSEMEGLPLVILEAMTARVPVVAARVGGIPEAVDSTTGVLIPADGSPSDYASAVSTLIDDPAMRGRLGDTAAARAQAEFSADGFAAAYHDLLMSLSVKTTGGAP
jgi:glycosyltransferase involved in cell wall biosynthesis